MPPSHASNTLSLQWTPSVRASQRASRRALRRHIDLRVHDRLSILLLSIGFAPWSCLETRAQQEARAAFEEHLADCPPETRHAKDFEDDSSDHAYLQGVWTYSADDRNGYYLIGRCGSTLFYYEDGAGGRLFGILVEGAAPRESILSCMLSPSGEPTTTFIVVLSSGMLVLCPCPFSGNMTSRFKPWTGASWHDPIEANRVGESPPQGEVSLSGALGSSARPRAILSGAVASDGKSSGSKSGNTISPLDFVISVQKLTLVDEHLAQQAARQAAVDKAASAFQMPAPSDGSSKGEASPKAARVGRPVDVSGIWNVMELTDGKFTLTLQQAADGTVEGQLRYVDNTSSGWSTKVAGRIEGRRIHWTAFAWKGGPLNAEESNSTATVISPCGRYLAGTGPTECCSISPPRCSNQQHFSAALQTRTTPAAARAASAVRDAQEQARRTEQEQPALVIPSSRSWVSSFSAVSFTAGQKTERTSEPPDPPVKRFSFSAGRRERTSEPPHTAPIARKATLTAQPWTDESPQKVDSQTTLLKTNFVDGPPSQLTSHRPGSKRAELARRWRTTVNVFRGGRGGYRGNYSETAGGAQVPSFSSASAAVPALPPSSFGRSWLSRSQSASVAQESSTTSVVSPRASPSRSVTQK